MNILDGGRISPFMKFPGTFQLVFVIGIKIKTSGIVIMAAEFGSTGQLLMHNVERKTDGF
jgi:hypothetical protein